MSLDIVNKKFGTIAAVLAIVAIFGGAGAKIVETFKEELKEKFFQTKTSVAVNADSSESLVNKLRAAEELVENLKSSAVDSNSLQEKLELERNKSDALNTDVERMRKKQEETVVALGVCKGEIASYAESERQRAMRAPSKVELPYRPIPEINPASKIVKTIRKGEGGLFFEDDLSIGVVSIYSDNSAVINISSSGMKTTERYDISAGGMINTERYRIVTTSISYLSSMVDVAVFRKM